jgi:hypothetical protein
MLLVWKYECYYMYITYLVIVIFRVASPAHANHLFEKRSKRSQ